MFAKGNLQGREGLDLRSGSVPWLRARQLLHQVVDVFELAKRRPAFIPPSPERARRQPDCKCLGKIFGRVRLRVPRPQVQDVVAAFRFWFVEVGIRAGERAEQFSPASFEV